MAKKTKVTTNIGEKEEELVEKKEDISEDKEDKEDKIKPIYVAPSQEIRDILDEHIKEGKQTKRIVEDAIRMYDNYSKMDPKTQVILDRYEAEYGSKIAEIEEAMSLLEAQKDSPDADTIDWWCKARDRGMMLIGKTTFNQLLAAASAKKDSIEKPQRTNNAMDIILWYLGPGKTIKNITLEEIIEAIQKMWTVSNYFDNIEYKKEGDIFYLSLMHQQSLDYSNYWLGYFQILFEMLHAHEDVPFRCYIEGEPFEQTISITIKELYENSNEENGT